jgi:hypothetical protein
LSGEVFISYRWTSSDAAARLAGALQQRLGASLLTLDVEKQDAGNLREQIQDDLRDARVLVVLIHPEWIAALPRLHDPDDWVRLEIEAANEFGIPIIPVLVNGAKMPAKRELPESVQSLTDDRAFVLPEHATYELQVDKLTAILRRLLPGRTVRGLEWLAGNTGGNFAFATIILGALLLFASRMIDIHTIHFTTEVATRIGDQQGVAQITREVGALMAWNWVVTLLVITPMMAFLFNHTLREAKELLKVMQVRRMIVYVRDANSSSTVHSRGLWEVVILPTSRWCQVFIVIAIVLSLVQWWQYSGQWWLWRSYSHESFLQTSTGEDWNIGWHLGVPHLAESAPAIATLSLCMYLVYGIGSAVTFSYFAFLFNFFSELSSLATSAGVRSNRILRLDEADKESGGLATFDKIQRDHARFCYWSIFAMYLMALRNAYLPPVCRLPEGVASAPDMLQNCSTMGGFASNIYLSLQHMVRTLLEGRPDFSILFWTYSEQNTFVVGSLLYAALITSFFYLISWRMTSIIEMARASGDSHVGDPLLRQIRSQNVRALVIMVAASISTVFLNLGPLVLILALLFHVIDRFRNPRR